ncbi:hypothetical protein [Streptomyces sp. ISL-86]|uniref:hypothetical protein n=1 Tax=Streptomyces sp. ISL-86 TaxID=2819187 RepID=UPI001BE523F2|nr:hypothetical protein [Streptomyces sp. ISL-86]MBT2458104.1 hypothetical protein [Streptomyces sp. ISL-86]
MPRQLKRIPDSPEARQALLRHGDLLVSRANTRELVGLAGRYQDVGNTCIYPDLMMRLRSDESKCLSSYLELVLRSDAVRRELRASARGTSESMVKIGAAAVEDLEVPLPSPEEQSRIVAAHNAMERRIATLDEVRTKLVILRRAAVDGLVAGPTARVGTLLMRRPRNGFSPLEVPEWSGLLALGLGCLTAEGFRPRQLKRIPDTDMARRFLLADGDLLMSRANTRELVGLAGLYKDVGHPCIYPDLMMRLSVDPELCLPDYLELTLSTPKLRRAIQAGARGTSESMVKISAEFAESLEVPVPSIEAQRRAVLAVAALDSRIAKQEAAIEKLRVVQQGVVEDLLMGRAHSKVSARSAGQRRPALATSVPAHARKAESAGRPTLTSRSG